MDVIRKYWQIIVAIVAIALTWGTNMQRASATADKADATELRVNKVEQDQAVLRSMVMAVQETQRDQTKDIKEILRRVR